MESEEGRVRASASSGAPRKARARIKGDPSTGKESPREMARERVRFKRTARQTLRTRCRSSFLKVAAPVAFRHHGKEQPGEYPSVMVHGNKGSLLRRGRQGRRKFRRPRVPNAVFPAARPRRENAGKTLIPRALRTDGLADITVWCPVEGFFRASFFPICCLYDG